MQAYEFQTSIEGDILKIPPALFTRITNRGNSQSDLFSERNQ
jgi:hypothetical protein